MSIFEMRRVRARRWLWLILLAFAVAPLFAVSMPAMLDYPNHLARMFIIANQGGPAENPYYQVHWRFTTNIAMDLIVPPLGAIIGVETAAKAFYLAAQALLIGGAVALERVVKKRVEFSPIVAAIFLYCAPFADGFLNFEFGLGLALWALALWVGLERRGWLLRSAVHAALAVALFVTHIFALGVYGFAAGLHNLWRFHSGGIGRRESAGSMFVLAAPAVALAAVALAGGAKIGEPSQWEYDPTAKLFWIFQFANGYNKIVSFVSMYFLVALLFLAARRGAAGFVRSGAWIAGGLAILYLALPSQLLGETQNEARLLAATAFLAPAFLELRAKSPAMGRNVILAAAALAAVNLSAVWWVWLSLRTETAAMIASLEVVAKGARVLEALSASEPTPPSDVTEFPIWHIPALAAAWRDAYAATLFIYPGDRPVEVRPAYANLGFEIDPESITTLAAAATTRVSLPPELIYARSWTTKYDYLYVVGPPAPNPMPDVLREVAAGRRFTLYEIEHGFH